MATTNKYLEGWFEIEQLCAQRHSSAMEITETHYGSLLAGESEWCLQCKCAVTFTTVQRIFDGRIPVHVWAFGAKKMRCEDSGVIFRGTNFLLYG